MPRLPYLLIAAALAGGFSLPAHAVGHRVDVQLVDRATGETLTPIFHDGAWWVAGRPGARYRVAIVNRDGRRTLNVLSIDGVNAISGATAAWNGNGYVLSPFDSVGVDGWRKNAEQIAAFEFASLPDSYAARTDRPANVGVIGVAVFDEQQRPLETTQNGAPPVIARRMAPATDASEGRYAVVPAPSSESSTSDALDAPLARAMSPSRDRLGTAYGATEQSSIQWVAFRRAHPTPDEVVTIHYDRLENLIAMGIVPTSLPPVAANPFPDNHRYAPEPPPRR